STYNQLHRHLAVSAFQSIAAWYGFTALNVSLTISQDYHLFSEMYDNFVHGTLKTNSRKENNSTGSLSKAITQSSADKRRARVCLHSFFKCVSLTPFYLVLTFCRVPETRTVTVPPTDASALSRILPVGVPINFWDPEFYNSELDLQEKAMYINTGVAFPLPKFCTTEHAADWVKMPANEFMVKYGNNVLALYKIPTVEELAGLASGAPEDDGADADKESTDLEDSDE
ncbi:hypothetical protein B0H17DRAFT_858701, partial [Mycena rosella]